MPQKKLTLIIHGYERFLEQIVPDLEYIMADVDKNLVSILKFATIEETVQAAKKAKTSGRKVFVLTTKIDWPLNRHTMGLNKRWLGFVPRSIIEHEVRRILFENGYLGTLT